LLDLHEARRAAPRPSSSSIRQFCLDQQLPICQDASKGEANQDTGTGDEGDVQAKCFRACARCRVLTDAPQKETQYSPKPACCLSCSSRSRCWRRRRSRSEYTQHWPGRMGGWPGCGRHASLCSTDSADGTDATVTRASDFSARRRLVRADAPMIGPRRSVYTMWASVHATQTPVRLVLARSRHFAPPRRRNASLTRACPALAWTCMGVPPAEPAACPPSPPDSRTSRSRSPGPRRGVVGASDHAAAPQMASAVSLDHLSDLESSPEPLTSAAPRPAGSAPNRGATLDLAISLDSDESSDDDVRGGSDSRRSSRRSFSCPFLRTDLPAPRSTRSRPRLTSSQPCVTRRLIDADPAARRVAASDRAISAASTASRRGTAAGLEQAAVDLFGMSQIRALSPT